MFLCPMSRKEVEQFVTGMERDPATAACSILRSTVVKMLNGWELDTIDVLGVLRQDFAFRHHRAALSHCDTVRKDALHGAVFI